MRLVRIAEGKTKLLVPEASLGPVPPTSPVFFNPAASINRDVTVAVTAASRGGTFCDSLASTGARGIRVATELERELRVTLVDFNRESLKVGRKNARLNRVYSRCEFVEGESNSFLTARSARGDRFSFVDVDPFGTPAPYLSAAISAVEDGGVLSATATDTAVLCGVHRRVCLRRYSSIPLNNHFGHETAVRILLEAIRREAAKLDLGIRPVLAHSTRHYVRVFARVLAGATKADEALKHRGHLRLCSACGDITSGSDAVELCAACGGKVTCAGPLWTGPLTDQDLVVRASAQAATLGLSNAQSLLGSLRGLDKFPPWGFSLEEICSRLHIASVSPTSVAKVLTAKGFSYFRQPFEKQGLKSDAPYSSLVEAVKAASHG